MIKTFDFTSVTFPITCYQDFLDHPCSMYDGYKFYKLNRDYQINDTLATPDYIIKPVNLFIFADQKLLHLNKDYKLWKSSKEQSFHRVTLLKPLIKGTVLEIIAYSVPLAYLRQQEESNAN
jgi:hypothetical protein